MAAEDLVRDRRSFGGGLGAADLGSCRFQQTPLRRSFRLI